MMTEDSLSPVTEISSEGRSRNFEFWPEEKAHGITVSVKRDDMIHPYISGNKWRKLKYLIESAREKKAKVLVTFGGAWSNHLLATACAGAMYDFDTVGLVRGDEGVSNPVLSLCTLYGMELIFVDRESYRDKFTLYKQFLERRRIPAEEAFFIDEGGSSMEAVQGCSEIISELSEVYDHIFCACGTGTTLAGLARGLNQASKKTILHGVPVLAGGEFIGEQARKWVPEAEFVLHTDYHFGGYARTSPTLIHFISDFVARTGILVEPVYTGKLFYAVFDLINRHYFAPNTRILVLHTGGLTGHLGMENKFLKRNLDLNDLNKGIQKNSL